MAGAGTANEEAASPLEELLAAAGVEAAEGGRFG